MKKTKEEMLKNFDPDKRRPWALDEMEFIISEGIKMIVGVSPETHDKLVRFFYENPKMALDQSLSVEGHVFASFIEKIRQLQMNNWPGYSMTDWHAKQLQQLITRTGIPIKRYANIGTGTTGDQAINAFYLLPDDAEIHIFELPSKINDIINVMKSIGLEEMFDRNFFFHPGNAAETLLQEVNVGGGFDLIDSQFFVQHLRGPDFPTFCRVLPKAKKRGGLININEMMLANLGFTKGEDNPDVLEKRNVVENYFRGDGSSDSLSFLKIGWTPPNGGHAWKNREEFLKDVLEYAGELVVRSGLKMGLPAQDIKYGTGIFIGMRYVILTLASALFTRLQALIAANNSEAVRQLEPLVDWAWKMGKEMDEIVTSEEFKDEKFTIDFPEVVNLVLE